MLFSNLGEFGSLLKICQIEGRYTLFILTLSHFLAKTFWDTLYQIEFHPYLIFQWINGRFLMSNFSNDGHKLNHQILSPCTKRSVRANLAAAHRISCLKKSDATFCGDGIVEENEDCDCGTVLQCIASRSCCGSPSCFRNKSPCRFLQHDDCRDL